MMKNQLLMKSPKIRKDNILRSQLLMEEEKKEDNQASNYNYVEVEEIEYKDFLIDIKITEEKVLISCQDP